MSRVRYTKANEQKIKDAIKEAGGMIEKEKREELAKEFGGEFTEKKIYNKVGELRSAARIKRRRNAKKSKKRINIILKVNRPHASLLAIEALIDVGIETPVAREKFDWDSILRFPGGH